jgi:four helix bundle protein
MHLRIGRKEAKETQYWLELLENQSEETVRLKMEAEELRRILSAIINKVQQKQLL